MSDLTGKSQITELPSLQYHTKVISVFLENQCFFSYSVGGVVVMKLDPKYFAGLTIFSLFCRLNLTLLFDLGVFGVFRIYFDLGFLGVLVVGVCVCSLFVCLGGNGSNFNCCIRLG
jgi:hypothetical protein